MAKFKSLVRLIGHCSVHRKFVLRAPLRRAGSVRENSGRSVGTGDGRKGERIFKKTDPQAPSDWGRRDQAPSWSLVSQELGSFSQVSGVEEQEEETAVRGPEGLRVVTPRGADPWAERAERAEERGLPLPGGAAATKGCFPHRTESPWPVRASHGSGPLAGPPFCPCQGGDRRPAQMTEMAGRSLVGRKSSLPEDSAK